MKILKKKDIVVCISDIKRLKVILNSRGYDASYEDIDYAWREHSRNHDCLWLPVEHQTITEIIDIVLQYLKEV